MRKILLIDLAIAAGIIYFALNLNQFWLSYHQSDLEVMPDFKVGQDMSKEKNVKNKSKSTVALSSYSVIGWNNVFRPQRKEWVPPPPKPKPKPKARPEPPAPPPPPPPPPLPEPELLGIIIDQNDKVALMQGHKREKLPSTPMRSSRRRRYRVLPDRYKVEKEPMGRYHVGDTISEAEILDIFKDRVVLKREGKVFEIKLRDPKKRQAPAPSRRRPRRR